MSSGSSGKGPVITPPENGDPILVNINTNNPSNPTPISQIPVQSKSTKPQTPLNSYKSPEPRRAISPRPVVVEKKENRPDEKVLSKQQAILNEYSKDSLPSASPPLPSAPPPLPSAPPVLSSELAEQATIQQGPSFFSRLLASGSSLITTAAAAQETSGIALWNYFNALAFIILITLIFIGIAYALSGTASIAQVRANWDKYRCDPSVMPFAALYGFNTSDNFNYCLGNIFDTKSLDITGPFSTVLGSFTSLLSMMFNSINSLRVGVATLGGGINVMFQDFTDRISTFFFQLRISAIRIKALIGRMYAIMFAVMYMGLSGITGMTSFSNTVLFGFLDTFCFQPDTEIEVIKKGKDKSEKIMIMDVQIGDILLPTYSCVTAKFHFGANGQPMVKLFDKENNNYVHVSSNHYLAYNGNWIRADKHPDALTEPQPFIGNSLICLNTSDHVIPIGNYRFRDYDETEDNNVDENTMRFIENTINCDKTSQGPSYPFREYYPAIAPSTHIKLKNGTTIPIQDITLGTTLSTGCTVIGKVYREISEYCLMPFGISSSTLVWNKKKICWERAATMSKLWTTNAKPVVFVSLFVTPSSIIELADGTMIRDSMELCSPDAELYYAQQLKQLKT
jgi:hypothetical protein